ncbi:unnamed protein product, partial [Taenia asiatica]|uniref:C2H2-type domain-containing protein n=2 Tax=Taenia asiatica TaxID=60517 RepID=A0A0R3VXC5_TAEAS
MTTLRSPHDHVVAQITRQLRPPHSPTTLAHHLKPSPRRHLPLSHCDQHITSPICLIDDKRRHPTTDSLDDRRTNSSHESASASDETWLTSSVSMTTRRIGDTPTPLPCVTTISQGNTNYVPRNTTASPDPTDIDKCTELEAMRQGLARIQAGHARPSDFLPQHQTTNVDPYIRRTLDEIRRSINEISADAALQQEVQQLRDSVKRLSLCQATTGTASNKSESQLAGLLQDIRASLRVAPYETGQCNIGGQEGGVMRALEEIRQSVHELQAAVDEVGVETEPVVDPTCENAAVMVAINDIRQSLHNLREGVSNAEQDNTNEHEDGAIMEALNEIRQSVNVLVNGTEEGGTEERGTEEEAANEVLQALTEIRNSVRVLAGEDAEGGKDDCGGNEDRQRGDAAMEMAVCAMVRSMEGLQKTVEKISEQLLTERSEGTSRCEKKEKRGKRKKTSKGKLKSSSDSEIDEDDIAQCIKECCQDSCKFGSTCDKLIRFLISQNGNSQRAVAPSVHYLVPPQTHPPRFIAPFYRMPRPMPPPPQAAMALPPPPIPY